MITSIVELPNFMARGVQPVQTALPATAICKGFSKADVSGDDGLYLMFDATITEGRDLAVDSLWKYKLTVVPMVSQGMRAPTFLPRWEVFVVTPAPIDVNNMVSTNVPIYPVYFRNHRGEVIMNVPAINRLFADTGVCSAGSPDDNQVLSTARFIRTINSSAGYNLDTAVDEQVLFLDWSPIGRRDTIVMLMNSIGIEDYERIFGCNVYEIRRDSIPLEIAQIASSSMAVELDMLLNREAMFVDVVADAAARSRVAWDNIQTDLSVRKCFLDSVSDTVLPAAPGGVHLMGTFMDLLYSTPGDDFWFDVIVDPTAIHDVYYKHVNVRSGYTTDQVRTRSGLDTSTYMAAAMNLVNRFPAMSQLIAHRTCLDELVLYYKTDLSTPVLWVDMVWWALATAPGLINSGNAACAI